MHSKRWLLFFILLSSSIFSLSALPPQQGLNPDPPDEVIKLIFIHHSTGENWLTDGYGDLGRELNRNNYFVSDTNYGWGPDYIGDRTDIPNWIEWFRSSQTPNIMTALFNESGQHSSYTRTLDDPGGENRIIIFKSCFPNSDLAGSPNDPPGIYEELSVSGAKYVYNELLKFFATRPDKLFIVITAPPLSDATNAKNARAFNQWLVNDWLSENNYALNNVAVFDFYNVLTGDDAHHYYRNGTIEHVVGSRDTLAYPSGDDHPSEQGSRKATEEFITLLNIYYHAWSQNAPLSPPTESAAAEPAQEQGEPQSAAPPPSGGTAVQGMIDDFESGSPVGTNGWETYWSEDIPASITCTADPQNAYGGSQSLFLNFDLSANAWATCPLFYDSQQDWSSAEGLSFYLRAQEPGLVFDIDIYAGDPSERETYLFTIETTQESVDGWVPINLYWSDFHRADWEENAGAEFSKAAEIVGLAFGMGTYPDTPSKGTIWVDELALMGQAVEQASSPDVEPQTVQEAQDVPQDTQEDSGRRISLPCGSAFALPMIMLGLGWQKKLKRY